MMKKRSERRKEERDNKIKSVTAIIGLIVQILTLIKLLLK